MTNEVEDIDENEDNVPSVTPAGKLSFLIDDKDHPDYKIFKLLDRFTKESIETLMTIIRDPATDPKLKAACCKDIISLRNDVSTARQKDAINRLVLESKQMMMSLPKMKTLDSQDDDEDKPNVIVDFSMITSSTPIDLSNVKL